MESASSRASGLVTPISRNSFAARQSAAAKTKSNQLYWLSNNGTVKRLKPCEKSIIIWGIKDGLATSRDRLKAPNDGALTM